MDEVADASDFEGQSTLRPARADARRNLVRVLQSAKDVFAASGLDAPMRVIASRAGVGIGTLYRHFPTRADLVAAVFRQELDNCADAAATLAAENPPFVALAKWTQLFVTLAVTKRGLAATLFLQDPAFAEMPARREQRLRPAFRALFHGAVSAGEIRDDVDADEFMDAISSLCTGAHDARLAYAQRMVALFVESLRRLPKPESD